MISRGKGKKAVSQSLTSNPFRMPRAEFTNCKERRPGGRKGSLDPFFMQKNALWPTFPHDHDEKKSKGSQKAFGKKRRTAEM